MKLEMKKMNVWVTTIQDKPGQKIAEDLTNPGIIKAE